MWRHLVPVAVFVVGVIVTLPLWLWLSGVIFPSHAPRSEPWLTDADQETLADAIYTAAPPDYQAAGCVFPAGRSWTPFDVGLRVALPRRYEVFAARVLAPSGNVLVVLRWYDPANPSQSFDALGEPDALCYAPGGSGSGLS